MRPESLTAFQSFLTHVFHCTKNATDKWKCSLYLTKHDFSHSVSFFWSTFLIPKRTHKHINKSAVLIVPSTICFSYKVLASPNPLFATWRTQNELRVVMVHYKRCFCFSVSCCKQHIKQVWSVHFTLKDMLEFQSLLTHVSHATKNTLNKLGLLQDMLLFESIVLHRTH